MRNLMASNDQFPPMGHTFMSKLGQMPHLIPTIAREGGSGAIENHKFHAASIRQTTWNNQLKIAKIINYLL